MSNRPKTVFCDIDGTLLPHTGNIIENLTSTIPLDKVRETILQWDKNNYTIVLTTGRKECTRAKTCQQLMESGIVFDHLLMGLPNGPRILINDRKTKGIENTAYAVNLVRNQGFEHLDLSSKYITVSDTYFFSKIEKPWGYEELVDINDKYVVKKLFMKQGHSCSTQYHELKRETIVVLSGTLHISIGKTIEDLVTTVYHPFETVTIEPYTIHKMHAVEDCLFLETSTNELWDVVRLEDSYGRVAAK